ncbi:hypothetical protein QYM36_011508 [Artemia franciscana]|uniref:Uncharacterized protein n=2 Tax=Artemia franciscana TaxID=6661 RepID=A0AA88HM68_ARTSF|nr:hypothetical protein QYM36_011508 [Artemia franciscana]KAK2712834.1 hypothetical protein QYM36_011508 [Artemia franciscana]
MPSLCIVPWCKAKRVKGIKFYKFPRQAGHRDQWLLALELDPKDVLNYKDPRVCPKHFPASAFSDTGRRQLPTSSTPVGNFTNGRNTQTRTQNLLGMMDPLQTETDEPLEIPNFVHADQALVRSFTLKEEESVDPLQIKNNEPLQVSNYSHPFYGLDTPKSGSGNSFQDLVGSSNEEEIVDPLQINNDEPMQFSNFSHSSYGSDNSKSSSWNSDNSKSSSCSTSQALVGSFILSEEGSFRNGCFQKKRIGLQDFLSTGETIWLASGSNSSKLDEKIYLKTTVEIEKLTKLTIEENCCGKWRCSACGKIENTFYFLQLHKSTNCETGLSFICEICREEINNYSDFAIHYIKHEADKEKKCPICLCPNVNNIKEHLIMRKHVSEDINGFKCTDNECKNSNEKAKLEAIFNSTINGYCQDTKPDILPFVKTQNMEVFPASKDVEAAETSPVSNQFILDYQEETDQAKPDLSRRKKNSFYDEFSDSNINSISDEDSIAEILPAVKMPNMEVFSTSSDVESSKISPAFNQLIPDNQKQADQRKLNLKRRNENAVCYGFSDSDVKVISNEDPTAEILPSVKTQNVEVSFISADGDTAKISPVSNQLELDNQEQPDQGKPNLRRKKNNTVYYEFSDSDINDISDEDTAADMVTSVEAQNMDVSSASVAVDTVKISPVLNYIMLGNQKRPDQERTDPRLSKPCRIKGISDEERIQSLNGSTSSSKNLVMCKVCGDKASGLHYGVTTCEACKVFFLRSILKQIKYTEADCLREGKCLVMRLNRSECQFCRFKKCLAVGMSRDFPDFQVNSLSKKSEKKAKKEHLSIVESTPDVQEKPNLRQRKENTVYIESSNSDIDDISDEGLQIHNQGVHKVISLDEAGTKNVPYDEGQVHLDVDNSLREFACSECSDLFSTHSQLIRHLKLHKKVGIAAVTEPSKNLNDESASNLMSSYHGDSTNHNSNERTTVGKNSEFREKLSTSPLIEAIHLYECGLCGKTFKDRKYFVRHLRTQHKQTESDLYECESCGKTFKDRKYFLRHLRTQHKQTENDKEDEMHECPFCQTKFEKKYHLCRHLMTHRDGSELKCNKCSESFSWPFELVTHLKMHKKTEIAGSMQPLDNSDAEPTSNSEPVTNNIAKESNFNECGICKKTYVNRRSLLRHLGRHVKGRTYLCNICGLSFFRANALNLHIQRHTGDKNFTCDKCGKNFYSMSLLNQHLKKHAAEESKQILEKLFECEICHKKFETKQIYSQHMKRHTEGKTQECGICQRKCYTKYQLAAHMRIHTGEKPYECKICNSTFAQRTNLKIHMRSHSEEKPYSCEFCSKSFKDKPAFKDHVNMHTGKKPYKCKQCDKTFTARKRLVAHKRSHSGGKKYSCDICNEVFAYANYRNLHMALHENPNPFGCEFCSKKFNYKKNLVLHVQRMHSSHNPFKCKLCGKTFDTSNKIETHIINRICGKKAMSLDNIKSQSTYHKELSNADGCSDACHLSEGIRSASTLSGNSDTLGLKKEKLFICNMCDQEYESVLEIANHYDFLHRKSQ